MHVGLRMRKRREALGISQGRLGRHLGLTFSQIQKYEKGTNRIGAGRLYQIAAFLGVPPSHFFEGIDSPAAPARAEALQRHRPARRVRTLNEAFARSTTARPAPRCWRWSARSPTTPGRLGPEPEDASPLTSGGSPA